MTKEIRLSDHSRYPAVVCDNALSGLGAEIVKARGLSRALVVSEENAWRACGDVAFKSLTESGFAPQSLVLPAGEKTKSLPSLERIMIALSELGMGRDDLIVALGGGMIGDLAGFAAATYMRGIDHVICPTTLLCAVDACVGGKTAVDLSCGKNLMGAFHQPRLIVCDTAVIGRLPKSVLREGIPEIVKHGLLADEGLLATLENGFPFEVLPQLILSNMEIKADYVSGDERDHGNRQLLNMGHTYAHALEKHTDYTLRHGEAVALGLIWECELSHSLGLCDAALAKRLKRIMAQHGLPNTPLRNARLADWMRMDKKNSDGKIAFALPARSGARLVLLDEDTVRAKLSSGS